MIDTPNIAFSELAVPKIVPPLDSSFRPLVLANRAFRQEVRKSGGGQPLVLGLERIDGSLTRYETSILSDEHPQAELNLAYVERLVKTLLWQKGGWRLTIGGPVDLARQIADIYSPQGRRAFDWEFMGKTVFERPFEIMITSPDLVPQENEVSMPLGRHLDGCRIGFDLGASDRKVAAVVDGETVFSEEVIWTPRDSADPDYHFAQIMDGLKRAAAHLPRVDAIGGSSAGVIIDNRPMVASLFRSVPSALRRTRIREMFVDLGKEWGVPLKVANDGDVTALAGAMSLDDSCVLGVAMGSSEAVGYVDADGNITGWLNELAFAPIDCQPDSPVDEWSGDAGCGAQYLTQQAVFRLASAVGIQLDEEDTLAAKLKSVQDLLEAGDERAEKIWETIGVYAGYAIAHYADFYCIKHTLVLGRVTSGKGGPIILAKAKEVLETEFPDLAKSIQMHLPDEKTRRVGQAVAAASLPRIG